MRQGAAGGIPRTSRSWSSWALTDLLELQKGQLNATSSFSCLGLGGGLAPDFLFPMGHGDLREEGAAPLRLHA